MNFEITLLFIQVLQKLLSVIGSGDVFNHWAIWRINISVRNLLLIREVYPVRILENTGKSR